MVVSKRNDLIRRSKKWLLQDAKMNVGHNIDLTVSNMFEVKRHKNVEAVFLYLRKLVKVCEASVSYL